MNTKKTVSEQRKKQYELLSTKLADFWMSNKGLNPKIMVYFMKLGGRIYKLQEWDLVWLVLSN